MTDGRTDTAKLLGGFRIFRNALKAVSKNTSAQVRARSKHYTYDGHSKFPGIPLQTENEREDSARMVVVGSSASRVRTRLAIPLV